MHALICVGKHNICVGNREIMFIGNREIKRQRICHDVKTANLNGLQYLKIKAPSLFYGMCLPGSYIVSYFTGLQTTLDEDEGIWACVNEQ